LSIIKGGATKFFYGFVIRAGELVASEINKIVSTSAGHAIEKLIVALNLGGTAGPVANIMGSTAIIKAKRGNGKIVRTASIRRGLIIPLHRSLTIGASKTIVTIFINYQKI